MSTFKIVVIGASAGGVESLITLFENMPSVFDAPIFIVRHFPVASVSHLEKLLERVSSLQFEVPENGTPIQPGTVYIAPTNRHMLVRPGRIELVFGPRENRFRPAIDPLFRTAAQSYGPRVIGVILSGTMDDGTAGMIAIKKAGGISIVQDPEEAMFTSMPLSVIERDHVDHVLPAAQIAEKLVELTKDSKAGQLSRKPIAENPGPQKDPKGSVEVEEPGEFVVSQDMQAFADGKPLSNKRTVLTCPECGGVLWEVNTASLPQYVCHVGHVYSLESMLSSQDVALEDLLWNAVRGLKERAEFRRRAAAHAQTENQPEIYQALVEEARKSEASARLIQQELIGLFS